MAENRLATAAKVKKFLFVLASRFGIVDEESIDELKELSENENTKKSTEQWKNVFVKWATESGKEKNLEA